MLLHIPDVLTGESLSHACERLESAGWMDGRVTAGHQSARVKDNLQLPDDHPASRDLGEMILAALHRSPLFIAAALPLRVFPPLFNRYEGGHAFGNHVDNAVRQVPGTPHRIRTDLSATLFLTEPSDYDGGELVVEDTGVHSVASGPGTSCYAPRPACTTCGRSRGARIASFFWIRHGPGRWRAHAAVRSRYRFNVSAAVPDHPAAVQLTGVYRNLCAAGRISRPFKDLDKRDTSRSAVLWLHLTAGVVAEP
jgi:PKHD-type hydroxylase